MKNTRIIAYLVTLLIVGVALGTITATKVLGNPFEYVWVKVARKVVETSNTGNVNTADVTWKTFTPRLFAIAIAYPLGYHLYLDSGLSSDPGRDSDIIYISPTPLDTTPRDGAIAALTYTLQRNKTQADFDAAVEEARDVMADVAITSVTYNEIAWTKMSGTQVIFGETLPKVVYVAKVAQANADGMYVIVTAQFDGNSAEVELIDVLDESVSHTSIE
ncbi:MAG: hypothetical protein KIH62_001730 [Candidatus Kerfeldbacteria bacterium]|nr:hypothetical protein [Candidatus Kerfeldbacteria bacterium]